MTRTMDTDQTFRMNKINKKNKKYTIVCFLIGIIGIAIHFSKKNATPNESRRIQEEINVLDGFEFVTVLDGIYHPTDFVFLPDNRTLITNKEGKVYLYDKEFKFLSTALDIRNEVCSEGERGLEGIAIHPDFDLNNVLYLYYVTRNRKGSCKTKKNDGPVDRVSIFQLSDDVITKSSERIVLETGVVGNIHHGGTMTFGVDGYLYVSIGDGGAPSNEENPAGYLNNLHGKIIRIDSEGNIPEDNPFFAKGIRCHERIKFDPDDNETKCAEIYHYGFRNPFNFAMDFNVDYVKMYVGDVGRETWEEISEGGEAYAGRHYGWPYREGPCLKGRTESKDCLPAEEGYVDPIYWYGRPGPEGQTQSAITGGAFIPDGIWPSDYDGQYIFTDLRYGRIYMLQHEPSHACRTCPTPEYINITLVEHITSSVHKLGSPLRIQFHNNSLFVLTYDGGSLKKLSYVANANRSPTAIIHQVFMVTKKNELTVFLDASASTDPDGDSLTYEWDFGDDTSKQTKEIVSHTYQKKGTYTVTLVVNDEFGGESKSTMEINVNNKMNDMIFLPWESDCSDDYDYCGQFEFCASESNDVYSYRLPCHTDCLAGHSPVIQLKPGKKIPTNSQKYSSRFSNEYSYPRIAYFWFRRWRQRHASCRWWKLY